MTASRQKKIAGLHADSFKHFKTLGKGTDLLMNTPVYPKHIQTTPRRYRFYLQWSVGMPNRQGETGA